MMLLLPRNYYLTLALGVVSQFLLSTKASISSYGGSHKNNSGSSARTRGYHGKNVQVITIQDKETLQRFANATASNVTYLLDHLLQQYDNSLRPDISGPPLVVEINMQVRSMGPISEVDMSYSMDCYFRQSWTDSRLAFSGRKTLALSIEMLRKIWKPDTYIFNGRKSYLHTITTPNKFMRLFPNGKVLYSQRLTIKASCQMDLSDFPMDKQNCPLYIGSFGYSESDVLYRWTKGRGVNIASDMKLSQFDLIQTPTGNATTIVNKGIHSTLVVGFLLQRHMGNFVIQVYGPCVLLVVISWVSFWLNREATSDRISLGVTTVLTMTFLGLEARTDLPQVAYPTALDYFVFISFMFIFSTVVQFALVHYFTKLGAGEYYLEELEETICMAEERLRQKRQNGPNGTSQGANGSGDRNGNAGNNAQDSAEVSFEDGTSFSGNSNNVFTTGGSEMIQANASNSVAAVSQQQQNQQPMFTVSFDDSYGNEDPFFPIFDNTILIDPIQRQREHFGQQHQQHHPTTTAAVFSAPQRSIVRHNCLNHHPYGTFYYSKKSGRTGRHCPPPQVPPSRDLPNSPVLNSHHHTVMAGGFFRNSNNTSAESNVRTSSGQSSNNSSKRRIMIDWAKSWKRYNRKHQDINGSEERDECQCKRCITRAMNNPEKALNSVSQIDKISRIVFPAAFALLNGFYWFSYLKHSQRIDLNFESA